MQERLDEERICALAVKPKEILEDCLLEAPDVAGPKIEEARAIKKFIEENGIIVRWKAVLDADKQELDVEVALWKPKEEMAPEDAAAYDEWLLGQHNIKPPSAENSKGGNQ